MPKYSCEFCAVVDDGDTNVVDIYIVGGAVCFCCAGCIQVKLPFDTRTPFSLPDGWEVVKTKKLDEINRENEVFLEVVGLIRSDAVGVNISLGHIDNTAYLYTKLRSHYCNSQKAAHDFREALGLLTFDMDTISTAHCPNCAGPMINVRTIDQNAALKDAAGKHFSVLRSIIPRWVFVCLNCAAAYVE